MSADPFARRGPIDVGDTVRHVQSGELWCVAAVSEDRLYPSGWPPGSVALSEVVPETEATDEDRREKLTRMVRATTGACKAPPDDPRYDIARARVLPNLLRNWHSAVERDNIRRFLEHRRPLSWEMDQVETAMDAHFGIDREALATEMAMVEQWEREDEERRSRPAVAAQEVAHG